MTAVPRSAPALASINASPALKLLPFVLSVTAGSMDVIGFLGCADEFEESLTRVQGAVGVVIAESAVVSPIVADFAELDSEGFARFA